ncbi:hypothetical protein HDU98_009031 [Podochytrium sp. JEL0797]|nr:hypothetical protein HDU98_009031 [Podochytrium sp. JEL0797]
MVHGANPLEGITPTVWIKQAVAVTLHYNVTSLQHFVGATTTAWYDCWALYDPVASCVSLPDCGAKGQKMPPSDGTNVNINTCLSYASWTLFSVAYSANSSQWDSLMQDTLGLRVDSLFIDEVQYGDSAANMSASAGMLVGNAVVSMFLHNEMNVLGDLGFGPYGDYTGFVPSNPAEPATPINLDLWQPLREHINISAPYTHYLNASFEGKPGVRSRTQTLMTPQFVRVRPFLLTPDDVAAITVPPPKILYATNKTAFIEQAQQVLDAVTLTVDDDYRRVLAEHNENKMTSLGAPGLFLLSKLQMDLKTFIHYEFLTNRAILDAAILSWKYKVQYMAVRPITAIHVLGLSEDFMPYLNTMAHAEYPSVSATLCQVFAEVASSFLGTDEFGYSVNYTQGSSFIYPGMYPTKNMTLTFPTFTNLTQGCGESRNMAGVHFMDSIVVGRDLGEAVGVRAFANFQLLLNGTFENADDEHDLLFSGGSSVGGFIGVWLCIVVVALVM